MRCPICQCLMVEKKGKFGAYMGCSDYPHCRHTQSIEDQTVGAKKLEEQADAILNNAGRGKWGR